MKSFWLSWYFADTFELHTPWWFSGYRDDQAIVCAAVQATDEDDAKRQIKAAHLKPPGEIEWRFIEENPAEWEPFNGRFRRADWMQWPVSDG